MAYEIDFKFEELPLLTVNGVEAGLVNGTADIDVLSDGDWAISGIYLEGYKDGKAQLVRVVNVPGTSEGALYLILHRELNETFADSIQEAVNEWRAENGFVSRDMRADHSTHHHAFQGV